MTSFQSLVVIVVLKSVVAVIRDNPIVDTNVGTIRGVVADAGNYTMFMGIPYAKVNETNVFGDAIPYQNFEGVFEANDDSAVCAQVEEFNSTAIGNLDCLHINIYVPEKDSTSLLPVMVYIYGGLFSLGFAGRYLYGPKYIIRHDVILVTLNYRVGPYGFMCLDTPEVSGNQGFKDQVLALRWIKNNIEAFGGNPDRITLFGNSAGAISSDLHLVSDTEKLFKNIILQSGSAYSNLLLQSASETKVFSLSELLGHPTDDLNDALSFLSTVEPTLLVETADDKGITFLPCIEKKFPGVNSFLTNYPININITKAEGTNVLLGYNSDEMLRLETITNPLAYLVLRLFFRQTLASVFKFDDDLLDKLEPIARKFYIGDNEVSVQMRYQIADFAEDMIFVYPAFRSIQRYLDQDIEKVYLYVFSYDGQRNFVKVKNNIIEPGVSHADEISYLFDMQFISGDVTPEDQLIIDRMTTLWTNFAKFDDPTPAVTQLLPVKWNPITKDSKYHYLDINTEMEAGMRYLNERMTFWDLFYEAYGDYLIGTDYVPPTDDKNVDVDEDDDVTIDDDVIIDDTAPSSSHISFISPMMYLIVFIMTCLTVS